MAEAIDLNDWERWWRELEAQFRAINYEPALLGFMGVLETAHAGFFERAAGPSGAAWPPLSPVTIRRKGHDTILVESGRLRASLSRRGRDAIRETTHRGLIFGTEVPYSFFHQTGTRHVPQREHIGLNEPLIEILLGDVGDATLAGLAAPSHPASVAGAASAA